MAMEMEKGMLDELLLVCTYIGVDAGGDGGGGGGAGEGSDEAGATSFVRGEEALEWARDLQRAMRRDDAASRPVRRQLGRLKVVEQKLLPLLRASRDDAPLVRTLLKIFVMLTDPLAPAAACALATPPLPPKKAAEAAKARAKAERRKAAMRKAKKEERRAKLRADAARDGVEIDEAELDAALADEDGPDGGDSDDDSTNGDIDLTRGEATGGGAARAEADALVDLARDAALRNAALEQVAQLRTYKAAFARRDTLGVLMALVAEVGLRGAVARRSSHPTPCFPRRPIQRSGWFAIGTTIGESVPRHGGSIRERLRPLELTN